jgi:DNA polymerase alpha subunit A
MASRTNTLQALQELRESKRQGVKRSAQFACKEEQEQAALDEAFLEAERQKDLDFVADGEYGGSSEDEVTPEPRAKQAKLGRQTAKKQKAVPRVAGQKSLNAFVGGSKAPMKKNAALGDLLSGFFETMDEHALCLNDVNEMQAWPPAIVEPELEAPSAVASPEAPPAAPVETTPPRQELPFPIPSKEPDVSAPVESTSTALSAAVPESVASPVQLESARAEPAPMALESHASTEPAPIVAPEPTWVSVETEPAQALDFADVEKEGDGAVPFYFIDAIEEQGTVFLFGKVLVQGSTRSCCVRLTELMRNVFFVLRDPNPGEDDDDVCKAWMAEFQQLKAERKYDLGDYGISVVQRRFCFGHSKVACDRPLNCIKLQYSYKKPTLPAGLSGDNWLQVFGTCQPAVELFLLKRKIKGPCWLSLEDCHPAATRRSFSALELTVDSHKQITVEEKTRQPPPLNVLSLSVKTVINARRDHEIAVLGGVFKQDVDILGSVDQFRHGVTLIKACRKLDTKLLPRDLEAGQGSKLEVFQSERALLNFLLSKVADLDPDVIIGHNCCGFALDVLAQRMLKLDVPAWHKLGRLRRMGKDIKMLGGRGSALRLCLGRLVCDTELAARETHRATSYDLKDLVHKLLGEQYSPLSTEGAHLPDWENLPKCYEHAKSLVDACTHTLKDAIYGMRMAWALEVLPLTRQLTTVCGNLWKDSLQNKRAERNDALLSHEFHSRKFLLPELQEKNKTTAKGAQYAGGLVLDPTPGLYTNITLCLDFNSLYPSLIREYNLCFTTLALTEKDVPSLPAADAEPGVLPAVMERLFEMRREVKKAMQKEKDLNLKALYNIRQKALKLVANSMYGTLGFTASRYHAQGIAALITQKGREALQDTVHHTREVMKYDVIYGDTDSIFVNTNCAELAAAMKVGQEIKQAVNKKYTKLEIEVDDIFKRILLLKKKKYAALKLDPGSGKCTPEYKGIDPVRRDWAPIAQECGFQVANLLLSDQSVEDIASQVLDLVHEVGQKIDQNEIPRSQYVITKGMTKMPHEYPDASSQAHVQVAKRMIAGHARLKPGCEIPYIMCHIPEVSLADRARHPDEVEQDPSLQVDFKWYKNSQIMPVIMRLCSPVEAIVSATLAESLGLDGSKFHERQPGASGGPSAILEAEHVALEDPMQLWARLQGSPCFAQANCTSCGGHAGVQVFATSVCKNCSATLDSHFVHNCLRLQLHALTEKFFEGTVVCDDDLCGRKTHQVDLAGAKCTSGGRCNGTMRPSFSEHALLEHLRVLAKLTQGEIKLENSKANAALADMVEEVMTYCGSNYLDCTKVFGAMY